MTKPSSSVALCSALALADAASAPEWIHLLPAGPIFTNDGRGPYRVADVVALMSSSLRNGDKLVLDENHATDLAAPRGEEAPARGWIVELQHRSDGVWGRVEWTDTGRQKIEAKEYRGVSPVILHRKDGTIDAVLRASLTNKPNFQGLTALHQEESMDFRAWLIEALGLDSTADDAAIQAALKAKLDAKDGAGADVALQSALAPIASALGLTTGADAAAVLAGVQQLRAGDGSDARITALQSELASVTNQLNTLQSDGKRTAATSFVDAAIAAGRVGVKPLRDDYISMHMENPGRTEKQINAMPILKGAATLTTTPGVEAKPGDLTDADHAVISLMGLDPEEYKKSLAAAGQQEAR
ncbi:phage protease [Sphingobium sp. TB-6]|uniref:phage protease n=1 Tax=Sphingobium sp. TB-6 TaxID=2728850 RepID=UPI0019D3198C|nr:phage protease [Sphingobium sp. TB-6]